MGITEQARASAPVHGAVDDGDAVGGSRLLAVSAEEPGRYVLWCCSMRCLRHPPRWSVSLFV
jgi:hypothetical protein